MPMPLCAPPQHDMAQVGRNHYARGYDIHHGYALQGVDQGGADRRQPPRNDAGLGQDQRDQRAVEHDGEAVPRQRRMVEHRQRAAQAGEKACGKEDLEAYRPLANADHAGAVGALAERSGGDAGAGAGEPSGKGKAGGYGDRDLDEVPSLNLGAADIGDAEIQLINIDRRGAEPELDQVGQHDHHPERRDERRAMVDLALAVQTGDRLVDQRVDR